METDSPKPIEKCLRNSGSLNGSLHKRHTLADLEDDVDSSIHSKSERLSIKCEDDWRRRTIIVEKKNGSYGFTLQSYGIHYKKEDEIEMITYVDYVDDEGSAHKSGMREGDVILSINGTDMEKADHKTLVNFIKKCDSPMRMVVLFEDCVRKVKLHLRYIQLQQTLQEKMNELESLTIREHQLAEGKWKTHSLPSQKKKTVDLSDLDLSRDASDLTRSTMSTENVASKHEITFTYQYLDPSYSGSCLIQSSNGGVILDLGPTLASNDQCRIVIKTPHERGYGKNIYKNIKNACAIKSHNKSEKSSGEKKSHGHRHRCNPCLPPNQDNNSLEAYDLASHCCDPQCVPSAKRRSRRQKECSKEQQRRREKSESNGVKYEALQPQHRAKYPCSSVVYSPNGQCRYRIVSTAVTSQCSLQSCLSSEASGAGAVLACDASANSYSTSISSDTLFWENNADATIRTPPKQHRVNSHIHSHYQHSAYYPQYKPKSWDNLAAKSLAGHTCHYANTDGGANGGTLRQGHSKGHHRNHSTKSAHAHYAHRHSTTDKQLHSSGYSQRFVPPTKSSESLVPQKYGDSALSCDCLDSSASEHKHYYQSNSDQRSSGYYSQLNYNTSKNSRMPNAEITRL